MFILQYWLLNIFGIFSLRIIFWNLCFVIIFLFKTTSLFLIFSLLYKIVQIKLVTRDIAALLPFRRRSEVSKKSNLTKVMLLLFKHLFNNSIRNFPNNLSVRNRWNEFNVPFHCTWKSITNQHNEYTGWVRSYAQFLNNY